MWIRKKVNDRRLQTMAYAWPRRLTVWLCAKGVVGYMLYAPSRQLCSYSGRSRYVLRLGSVDSPTTERRNNSSVSVLFLMGYSWYCYFYILNFR